MVAGKLDKATTHFTTKSGRKVLIEIYVEPGKKNETGFALTAIKKAMKWDEELRPRIRSRPFHDGRDAVLQYGRDGE